MQGLVNVPMVGDLLNITLKYLLDYHIPNSWVMFNWDIYQPLPWLDGDHGKGYTVPFWSFHSFLETTSCLRLQAGTDPSMASTDLPVLVKSWLWLLQMFICCYFRWFPES